MTLVPWVVALVAAIAVVAPQRAWFSWYVGMAATAAWLGLAYSTTLALAALIAIALAAIADARLPRRGGPPLRQFSVLMSRVGTVAVGLALGAAAAARMVGGAALSQPEILALGAAGSTALLTAVFTPDEIERPRALGLVLLIAATAWIVARGATRSGDAIAALIFLPLLVAIPRLVRQR
jgi:hypothetical protein